MDNSNLVVDIGNSKIKAALFQGGKITKRFFGDDLATIKTRLPGHIDRYMFCTVRDDHELIRQLFQGKPVHILGHETPIPIVLDYDTPETLGLDRLAVAVGAFDRFQNDSLIIDAGTCITYDLVEKSGTYKGGAIAPGLNMRMQAMAEFTASLPDIRGKWTEINDRLPGKTTKECLLQGARQAMLHEINGFIGQFMERYPNLGVIMTGGDVPYFESNLKATTFADFDLAMIGLNRILNYNK